MTHKLIALVAALAAAVAFPLARAAADPPVAQLSGAIFTSDASGVPVNLNHYADKHDVYLNGGPGVNAPIDAAGLPAGIYTFQVTDPSGKTLLSTDAPECRQVTVGADGRFLDVAPSGACGHVTGIDGEDGGITVQLFPFDDTPNNGNEYKAWLTPTSALNCSAPGNKHCFVPGDSKTDNFKVKAKGVTEIDTRFHRNGALVDGLAAQWTDTLGAHNVKYSEWAPQRLAYHEAHVEAAERGSHVITVSNQAGCTVLDASGPTGTRYLPSGGTVTVPVQVKNSPTGDTTYFVDVHCG